MQLQKIDTIEALQLERQRLETEAEMARLYLSQKTQQTLQNSKALLKKQFSWPALLGSLLSFGSKNFSSPEGEATTQTNPTWMSGLRQGLAAAESNDPQEWLKLIPIALEIWQQQAEPAE